MRAGDRMRTLTTLIVMAALAATLSACGRRGKPIPPDGAYTRTYPDIQFPEDRTKPQDQGTENTSR